MEERQTPEKECVDYLINHSYIKNSPPENFLREYMYQIPIQNFICYCVGIFENERKIQCIRILGKTPSDKISTIHVEWYNPENYSESTQFWVNSGVSLKRHFFLYQDQLNFFRSTFIFFPELMQYYRISSILNYIHLPEINPTGLPIYHTCIRFTLYNKKLIHNPNKLSERKKKELRKYLQGCIKKNNIDNFMEKNYPHLFNEIMNVIR